MPRKVDTLPSVRLRAYPLVDRAVEEGVAYGVARAFKHAKRTPSEQTLERIRAEVQSSVMNELSELFDFEPQEI